MFAADERERRAAQRARSAAELERRRAAAAARDTLRWTRDDAAAAAASAREAALRAHGGKARRNASSVAYNPVTQAYHASPAGDALRAADDARRARGATPEVLVGSAFRVLEDPITHVRPAYLAAGGGGGAPSPGAGAAGFQ